MKQFETYDDFKKDVIDHLGESNPKPWGVFKRNNKRYSHIVDIPEGCTQDDIIKEILDKDGVKPDLFSSPHRYAHHLNSSQVVCYEFFRPKISTESRTEKPLLDFLDEIRIPSHQFAEGFARFEWVPYPEENTNFDFYIQQHEPVVGQPADDARVYFEIKYTEQGFGGCPKDEEHKLKFKKIYRPMIEQCACLSKIPAEFDDSWRKNYQLFRNVLRITKDNWQNEYVVFLFPKQNKTAYRHFHRFKEEFISPAFEDHVKSVYWEDVFGFMSDIFRGKFFYYTL